MSVKTLLLLLLLLLAHRQKSCIPPPLQRVDANWICSSCASNLFPSCSNALYNPHVCKPYNGPLSGSVYKGEEFIKGTSTPTWYSTQAHSYLAKGQTNCACNKLNPKNQSKYCKWYTDIKQSSTFMWQVLWSGKLLEWRTLEKYIWSPALHDIRLTCMWWAVSSGQLSGGAVWQVRHRITSTTDLAFKKDIAWQSGNLIKCAFDIWYWHHERVSMKNPC